MRSILGCALAVALTAAPAPSQTGGAAPPPIPAHPRELVFPPLSFSLPDPKPLRHVLRCGAVAYLAEDRELPLVRLHGGLRGGGYLDPKGKEGLASLTGALMRLGGTEKLGAKEFDERLEFLAAEVDCVIGDTTGSFGFDCLSKDLDEVLGLFSSMLRAPRFEEERVALVKRQTLDAMAERNDDAADVAAIEWGFLMREETHFENAYATKASIEAIAREDLARCRERLVHPRNMVVAVSGDFDAEAMIEKLEAAFADLAARPFEPLPPVPAPREGPARGFHLVEKDVPQAQVLIGGKGIRRDDPDAISFLVLNEILGGDSFTARLVRRIRSDEGLAYGVSSSFDPGVHYPGDYAIEFQTKSASVAHGLAIVFEELRRLRTDPVPEAELAGAKSGLVEKFPAYFPSRFATLATFAAEELSGRDPAYWSSWREKVAAVTAEDVLRAARRIDLAAAAILVVGRREDVERGDASRPEKVADFAPGGVRLRPLRDPMTMR